MRGKDRKICMISEIMLVFNLLHPVGICQTLMSFFSIEFFPTFAAQIKDLICIRK